MEKYINGFSNEQITVTEKFIGDDAMAWFSYTKNNPVQITNEDGEVDTYTAFTKPLYVLDRVYIKVR